MNGDAVLSWPANPAPFAVKQMPSGASDSSKDSSATDLDDQERHTPPQERGVCSIKRSSACFQYMQQADAHADTLYEDAHHQTSRARISNDSHRSHSPVTLCSDVNEAADEGLGRTPYRDASLGNAICISAGSSGTNQAISSIPQNHLPDTLTSAQLHPVLDDPTRSSTGHTQVMSRSCDTAEMRATSSHAATEHACDFMRVSEQHCPTRTPRASTWDIHSAVLPNGSTNARLSEAAEIPVQPIPLAPLGAGSGDMQVESIFSGVAAASKLEPLEILAHPQTSGEHAFRDEAEVSGAGHATAFDDRGLLKQSVVCGVLHAAGLVESSASVQHANTGGDEGSLVLSGACVGDMRMSISACQADWQELPPDLLVLIALKAPGQSCDFAVSMSKVCKAWRSVLCQVCVVCVGTACLAS